jgi:hypothetical protein
MTDEGKLLQQAQIGRNYTFLRKEGLVRTKDGALDYIFQIGQNYDGADSIGELRAVIDDMIAYAMIGKECVE